MPAQIIKAGPAGSLRFIVHDPWIGNDGMAKLVVLADHVLPAVRAGNRVATRQAGQKLAQQRFGEAYSPVCLINPCAGVSAKQQ